MYTVLIEEVLQAANIKSEEELQGHVFQFTQALWGGDEGDPESVTIITTSKDVGLALLAIPEKKKPPFLRALVNRIMANHPSVTELHSTKLGHMFISAHPMSVKVDGHTEHPKVLLHISKR